MRRLIINIALLIVCLFIFTGCTQMNQIEDLAFAIVLGVDLLDNDMIEVCIQVPKIAGQRGGTESSGQSESSDHLVYSASGEDFDEALILLQWAVPRRLDLSQIKLITVSDSLAQSEQCRKVFDTIMATPRLYTAARLAVCKGRALDFLNTIKADIGASIVSDLSATFEDYTRNGFIPDTTFADVYYAGKTVYSDALAIYGEAAQSSAPEEPASAIIPANPQTSNVKTQTDSRFLGAAVFRKERMVGRLSGEESLYCKILRGENQAFPFSVGGKTVGLATLGAPNISIDADAQPMVLNIGLCFSLLANSGIADPKDLEQALEEGLTNTIDTCRDMGAEPFDFAERAAGHFITFSQWNDFDWSSRFRSADITIDVKLHLEHS